MKKYLVAAIILLASCKKYGVDTAPIDADGEVLFISRRVPNSSDWQIVLMNADGSNQRVISNSFVSCLPLTISNDHTNVVYMTADHNYQYLYVSDIDGQHQTLLSRGRQYCGDPAWSADGSKIVFVKNDNASGGSYDIYTINADGTDERKLTTEGNNTSPRYLNNNTIIYSSSNNSWWGVYTMNTNGGNKQLLTEPGMSFAVIRVSPSGNRIACVSVDWNGSQLFVMNADGTNMKKLTATVSSGFWDTGFPRDANSNPVWSPDGEKLAYVSYENGSPDIFVINANGTGNRRLTNTPSRDEDPAWSSDGKYIFFTSNRNNEGFQIYVMRNQGQMQTPISNYNGSNALPVFVNQ